MRKNAVAQVGVIVAGHLPPIDGLREGLQKLGWAAEKNIHFELRAAGGVLDRLPEFASEIVQRNVDVVAVIGAVTVRAVRKATTDKPIVFAIVVEPLGDGMASNIERPGGNATGVTTFDPAQARTQLKFLQDIVPGIKCVGVLSDLGVSDCMSSANSNAARELGMTPHVIRLKGPTPNFKDAIAEMRQIGAQALVAVEEPIIVSNRKQIADMAVANRLPSLFAREQADAGGLIAYGTSLRKAAEEMAPYVDKILNGAHPGDLPIRAIASHEFVANLRTAQALGISMPAQLLQRASLVIE